MKNLFILLFAVLVSCGPSGSSQQEETSGEAAQYTPDQLMGAWEATLQPDAGGVVNGVAIITDGYISSAVYSSGENRFVGSTGGAWSLDSNQLEITYEFNTTDTSAVGATVAYPIKLSGDTMALVNGVTWTRIDDGTPGELAGAWLITGRQRDGVLSRTTPGVRKTMKILSGTRFQWIAYNTETAEFFGTGGGTYTTEDSTYTEIIDFFSRDSSRVGASLEFQYQLDSGEWHHSGLSSKGTPIYEIWTPRTMLDAGE